VPCPWGHFVFLGVVGWTFLAGCSIYVMRLGEGWEFM